jgi:hypothetical protein
MDALLRRWPILLIAAILFAAALLHSPKSGRHVRAAKLAPAITISTIPRMATPLAVTRDRRAGQLPAARAVATRVATARAFARSYLRFLDGQITTAQLHAATPRSRREAARGGRIPAGDRAGSLTLAGMEPVGRRGTPEDEFVMVADDHARRSYPAQITLARVNQRWQVINLVPPELQMILMPNPSAPRSNIRSRPARGAPSAPARVRTATNTFLSTYLRYTYGQLPARRVKNASPQLRNELERQPPNVPAAVRSLHPVVRSLAFEHDPAGGWVAVLTVSDAQQSYVLSVEFKDRQGRWLATVARP